MTQPEQPTHPVSRSALAIVQRMHADCIERELEHARDHLKNVVRAATQELTHLEQGMTSGADFVSQHAEKYALTIARLDALGETSRSLDWLARQEPSA